MDLGLLASAMAAFGSFASLQIQPAPTLDAAERLGFNPISAAVIGVNESDVRTSLASLQAEEDLRLELALAAEALTDHAAVLHRTEQEARRDPGNEEAIRALQSARSDHAAALLRWDAANSELSRVCLSALSQNQRLALQIVQSNASRDIPIAFTLLDIPGSEWVSIEAALAAERRAIARGELTPPEVSRLLADIRSDQSVIEAQVAYDANHLVFASVFAEYSE